MYFFINIVANSTEIVTESNVTYFIRFYLSTEVIISVKYSNV